MQGTRVRSHLAAHHLEQEATSELAAHHTHTANIRVHYAQSLLQRAAVQTVQPAIVTGTDSQRKRGVSGVPGSNDGERQSAAVLCVVIYD